MLGTIHQISKSGRSILVTFNEPVKFKVGAEVTVELPKKIRSLNQNRLYWSYLTWIISREGGGLIDQGHFSPDALHQDIKCWITDKYPHQFDSKAINRFTTTELNTQEFTNYIEIVDRELMVSFFGINTAPFWSEVKAGEVLG